MVFVGAGNAIHGWHVRTEAAAVTIEIPPAIWLIIIGIVITALWASRAKLE